MQQADIPTTLPLFGSAAAVYGWKLGANVGYVGQGMIMGPRVCISMLCGAVMGFGILAPMAVHNGWANESQSSPDGSVAWVSWLAMSVMIADSLTSLLVLLCRYLVRMLRSPSTAADEASLQTASPVERAESTSQAETVFIAAAGNLFPPLTLLWIVPKFVNQSRAH